MFNPSQFFYVLNATLVVNEQSNVYYDITPGCLLISINNQLIQVNQFSINFITNTLYFKYKDILYVSSIQVSEQKDMLTIGNILTTNVSDNLVQTTDSFTQLYFKSTNDEELNEGVKIEFYLEPKIDKYCSCVFEGTVVGYVQDSFIYNDNGTISNLGYVRILINDVEYVFNTVEYGTTCYLLIN